MCPAFSLLLCLACSTRTWAKSLETKESRESAYETVVSDEGEDYCGSSEAPETPEAPETDKGETSIGESNEVEENQTNTSSGKVSIKKSTTSEWVVPFTNPHPSVINAQLVNLLDNFFLLNFYFS